ncbi:MAG: nucleoside phosphorylase [Geobacteraceae bacterium]|nr:nucleoside phosphorylase [Geobacteraceae bacterium]
MENGSFSAAELPLRGGRIYHLDLLPEELASHVIVVGDPERVPFLAEHVLDRVEVDRNHRGFRSITGQAVETGQRLSIITSGIGAPSMEIVLNELVALNEFDFATRKRKEQFDPLTVVRVGTCGGLQPETDLGTLIVTDYGIGMDNTGLFYDAALPDDECRLLERRVRTAIEEGISEDARFRGRFFPYAVRADSRVRVALEREALHLGVPCKRGITVTSPGFFAEQGRALVRVSPTVSDLVERLAAVDTGIAGLKIENMEMEASVLLHILSAGGYRAGVICAVIDKKNEGSFRTDYLDSMLDATRICLRAFRVLQPV